MFRAGSLVTIQSTSGATLRTTAAPLFVTSQTVAGKTSLNLDLPAGRYLAVLRKPGFARRRVGFQVPRENLRCQIEQVLTPERDVIPGFIEIPRLGQYDRKPHHKLLAMQEREVTAGEYLEFVNEVARTDPDRAATLAPRVQGPSGTSGDWRKRTDGAYELSPGWRPDLPIHAVTWRAATAYAEWFDERMRARGSDRAFRLPTFSQWLAAQGTTERFCFGDSWRPTWVKSCFSRPVPGIEPVLRFPVDESCYGVRDLSGSVCEWLSDWFWEEKGQRRFAGGSWAHARARYFEVNGVQGQTENWVGEVCGFRLVAVER